MSISNIFKLLAGIALFLYGMTCMGDGLKKVAGSSMELILYRLSNTPVKGILLGAGVTAVIQSSSATSIMVVGFVNSGMMKVRNAIGIIMGAIIGTSITGWIIGLSSLGGSGIFEIVSTDTLTAIIAVAGIFLRMFTKTEKNHHIGDIMLGFAVLMFGISTMSTSVAPLRESPTFINLMTSFKNPIIGILIGIIFTSVIQSASAAVGILQALSVTGTISFQLALPIIMGIAIGAAVPVLLSALGATVNGVRTAFTYLLVDTLGVIAVSIIFYTANSLIGFPFMTSTVNMFSIALINTLFRIIIVLIEAPFMGLLEKLVSVFIKDKGEKQEELKDVERLEDRFLLHPTLAIEQTRITINTMAQLAKKDILDARALIDNYTEEGFKEVCDLEDIIDTYEDKLGTYIVKIMKHELSDSQNREVCKFFHSITDIERMSDHARNLGECADEIERKKIRFSDSAVNELNVLLNAVTEIVTLAVKAFTEDDMESAYHIEPLEQTIDNLCDEIKLRHVERIQQGICEYDHGFAFNDILTNCERIGDHCSNIGIAVNIDNENMEYHDMENRMANEKVHGFVEMFSQYSEKYSL